MRVRFRFFVSKQIASTVCRIEDEMVFVCSLVAREWINQFV
jgi:hypothetical protein